jgi:hypothetical protein
MALQAIKEHVAAEPPTKEDGSEERFRETQMQSQAYAEDWLAAQVTGQEPAVPPPPERASGLIAHSLTLRRTTLASHDSASLGRPQSTHSSRSTDRQAGRPPVAMNPGPLPAAVLRVDLPERIRAEDPGSQGCSSAPGVLEKIKQHPAQVWQRAPVKQACMAETGCQAELEDIQNSQLLDEKGESLGSTPTIKIPACADSGNSIENI